MATGVATGFFSEILDDRLRNYGRRLTPDAIALLDGMEQHYMARRGFDGDGDAGEDALEQQKVRSLDLLVAELGGADDADDSGDEMIDAARLRRIIDFFCPGLPPIC